MRRQIYLLFLSWGYFVSEQTKAAEYVHFFERVGNLLRVEKNSRSVAIIYIYIYVVYIQYKQNHTDSADHSSFPCSSASPSLYEAHSIFLGPPPTVVVSPVLDSY